MVERIKMKDFPGYSSSKKIAKKDYNALKLICDRLFRHGVKQVACFIYGERNQRCKCVIPNYNEEDKYIDYFKIKENILVEVKDINKNIALLNPVLKSDLSQNWRLYCKLAEKTAKWNSGTMLILE